MINIKSIEARALSETEDLTSLSADEQFQRIMEKVSDISDAVILPAVLLEKLKKSKRDNIPLRVKFGIDPTGPDIHIGHAVSLINLRLFQRMGHKIVLVIGDFTGMIGDPSDRLDARPSLTEEEVHANMSTYEQQASKIINLRDSSIERHYNSEWMSTLTIRDWIKRLQQISVNELLQREDFRKRIAAEQKLSVAEMEYALFMGYDSVVLRPDIELGGVDQFLNMHMCRQMMVNDNQEPEIIISYNLLPGITGEIDEQGRLVKMSKSRGNYIPVMASPEDMYGKVMSIPDDVMWIWFRELTNLTKNDIQEMQNSIDENAVHPKEIKQLLARIVVGTFNHFDMETIVAAEKDFNDKFGKDTVLVPDSTQIIFIEPEKLFLEQLMEITSKSKGEIKRLVQQQGIKLLKHNNYQPVTVENLNIPSSELAGSVIKVGKRHYYRLELRSSTN